MGIFSSLFGRKAKASSKSLDYLDTRSSLNYQVSCNYLRKLFLSVDFPPSTFYDNIALAEKMVKKVVQKCSDEGYLIPLSYHNLPITFVSNRDRSCYGYIIEFDDASKECDCNYIGMMVIGGERVYYTSEYYAMLKSFSVCCFYEDGRRLSGIGDTDPRTLEEFKQAIIGEMVFAV